MMYEPEIIQELKIYAKAMKKKGHSKTTQPPTVWPVTQLPQFMRTTREISGLGLTATV